MENFGFVVVDTKAREEREVDNVGHSRWEEVNVGTGIEGQVIGTGVGGEAGGVGHDADKGVVAEDKEEG